MVHFSAAFYTPPSRQMWKSTIQLAKNFAGAEWQIPVLFLQAAQVVYLAWVVVP